MAELVGVTSGTGSAGSGDASPASGSSGSSSAVVQRPSPAGVSSSDGTGTSEGDGLESQTVPHSRFKEVNDKYTRLKWAEDFGDAEPETIRAQVALAKWANDDPRGFYEYYSSQLRAQGIIQAPQPPRANGRAEAPDGPPGPDYRDPQTGLTVYSADQAQKLVQYYVGQIKSEFESRLAPTEKFLGTAQVQMRARNEAQQILSEASKWPHFETNKTAIFEEMRKNNRLSLESAYRRVVIPTLEAKARQDVIASTEAKTGATTISPSSAQGGGKEDLSKMSIGKLLQREFRKKGIGR